MVELLSPVGDFDCLKAAVQNGANAVYFGSNLFSARAFATNFQDDELEQAINYAKLRGVKTHLTLNTLIKNNEFESAFNVAKKAYEYGIDAIIVQDLGLASYLIKSFPDLQIHASTQMTTTNIEQVKKLKDLGFSRVVLSRECSLSEIKNISMNTDIEIEVFVHGALCISYSGQCLFSSMIGGRSGNRGACAQPCRLPYSLVDEKNKLLDKGYLLSTKDLCSLENLPKIISYGVTSLKIEGRMKSPTYVATVTRIYRKYLDLATKFNNKEIDEYIIEEKDKNDLLQVFNRGGFSSGHLLDEPNKQLVFSQKPNNMGIYLGKVIKFNSNKGLITSIIENKLSIGDSITFENENTKYTVSELMENKHNIKYASPSETVTFGRMKGNIHLKDKIYKITDKNLSTLAIESFSKENVKSLLYCSLNIHANEKIKVLVKSLNFNLEKSFEYDYIPENSKNVPITKDKIINQFTKTLNTCYEFSKIDISIDENIFIPTSILNDIRRKTILEIESTILKSFKRNYNPILIDSSIKNVTKPKKQKSILLNILHTDYDYSNLKSVDKIYIPFKFFCDKKYHKIIHILENKAKIYIFLPIVIKDRLYNSTILKLKTILQNFNIFGCVLSELSCLKFLSNYSLDLVANYSFNVFNEITFNNIYNLGFSTITLSPELDNTSYFFNENSEIIVYGKIPLMTLSYCLLGKSNRCYSECSKLCNSNNKFYLQDRYNFKFRIIPDNMSTITTIYSSKNINLSNKLSNCIRFDFLDETIEEINSLI